MQTVGQQLIISAIPTLPALVFFVLTLFGRLLKENAQFVAILGVTVSLVFSVFALLFVAGIIPGGGQPIEFSVNWIDLGEGGSFSVGVYIDGLAAVMLVVVCFVSLMIQLYSGGFMEGDRRFAWYYPVLNLFTASMLGLVLAPNFIELYICWELVGLCSYLLIGHWFEKPSARDAAQKAFIVTRIGDAALFIGIIIFWRATGTTSFDGISEAAQAGFVGGALFTAAGGVGFFGGGGEERAVPLTRVVAGRDGGSDAGLGPDPRRHHGRCGGLPRGPDIRHLRAERAGNARRGVHRWVHGAYGGDDGAGQEGHKAGGRLLDGFAARVHDAGAGDRVLHGGDLPPLQPRLLQIGRAHV